MLLNGMKECDPRLRTLCGGFSFLELMVSLSILATSILLVLGLFVHLFNASQKGVDLTAGTVAGESALQEFLYDTPWPAQRLASPYSGMVPLNNQSYLYYIYVQDLNTSLKRVDMIVTWWNRSPDKTAKEGYGMLKTEIARLIYRNSRIFEP
jgi:hypothetical protein